MSTELLEKQILELSDDQKLKVANYVQELLSEVKKNPEKKDNLYRGYGSLKGKIWMSEDFDAPLEDFKEYM